MKISLKVSDPHMSLFGRFAFVASSVQIQSRSHSLREFTSRPGMDGANNFFVLLPCDIIGEKNVS